ncbi:MAG: GNAT family N-acetyltransferase [Butyrivibrio sp.]|nr:GNAT family N-acetyltransferase [Butyrivibrio sp.]
MGFDVVEEYRNRGYATEIVTALIEQVHDLLPASKILVKMRKDNDASRRVAEKCKGIFTGYEDSIVSKTTRKVLANCEDEKKREELQAVIEKGRNGVLVYAM